MRTRGVKGAAAAKSNPGVARPRRVSLGFLLRSSYRLFVGNFSLRLAEYGLSHSTFLPMFLLHYEGKLSPGTLTKRLEVTKSACTAVLKQLAAKGLVTVTLHDTDSRRAEVDLSQHGTALFLKILRDAEECERAALASFTREERTELLRLLSKLIDSQRTPPAESSRVGGKSALRVVSSENGRRLR